jgi:hypothetical protein
MRACWDHDGDSARGARNGDGDDETRRSWEREYRGVEYIWGAGGLLRWTLAAGWKAFHGLRASAVAFTIYRAHVIRDGPTASALTNEMQISMWIQGQTTRLEGFTHGHHRKLHLLVVVGVAGWLADLDTGAGERSPIVLPPLSFVVNTDSHSKQVATPGRVKDMVNGLGGHTISRIRPW